MVEVSRDGRRVYLTNSLYASWDAQFYPEGIHGWMVKLDARRGRRLTLDPDFFVDVRRRAAAPGAPAGRRRLVGLVLLPGLIMPHIWIEAGALSEHPAEIENLYRIPDLQRLRDHTAVPTQCMAGSENTCEDVFEQS